jgi:hypothetical protein
MSLAHAAFFKHLEQQSQASPSGNLIVCELQSQVFQHNGDVFLRGKVTNLL